MASVGPSTALPCADDERRGPYPAPLRGRASAALIVGSTVGAKKLKAFKRNRKYLPNTASDSTREAKTVWPAGV